jgi:hypothetical protein
VTRVSCGMSLRTSMCALIALAALIGGCSATKSRVLGKPVAVVGIEAVTPERHAPRPKQPPMFGIIVENRLGSVRVIADPSVRVPSVRAKVLGSDSAADATPEWIAASMERIDELNTIQVLSADPSSQPKSVDIRITVPAALGVRWNCARSVRSRTMSRCERGAGTLCANLERARRASSMRRGWAACRSSRRGAS